MRSLTEVCCCHVCSANGAEHTDVVGGSRVERSFMDHFLLMSQSVFSLLQPISLLLLCMCSLFITHVKLHSLS